MHSHGALVEDVWLSNALSMYSVPIDFDLPRLDVPEKCQLGHHGPGQSQVLA